MILFCFQNQDVGGSHKATFSFPTPSARVTYMCHQVLVFPQVLGIQTGSPCSWQRVPYQQSHLLYLQLSIKRFVFIIFIYGYMCVSICRHICIRGQQRPEGIGSPGAIVIYHCMVPNGVLRIVSGPFARPVRVLPMSHLSSFPSSLRQAPAMSPILVFNLHSRLTLNSQSSDWDPLNGGYI